jgi:translation initiation factor IF-2
MDVEAEPTTSNVVPVPPAELEPPARKPTPPAPSEPIPVPAADTPRPPPPAPATNGHRQRDEVEVEEDEREAKRIKVDEPDAVVDINTVEAEPVEEPVAEEEEPPEYNFEPEEVDTSRPTDMYLDTVRSCVFI